MGKKTKIHKHLSKHYKSPIVHAPAPPNIQCQHNIVCVWMDIVSLGINRSLLLCAMWRYAILFVPLCVFCAQVPDGFK